MFKWEALLDHWRMCRAKMMIAPFSIIISTGGKHEFTADFEGALQQWLTKCLKGAHYEWSWSRNKVSLLIWGCVDYGNHMQTEALFNIRVVDTDVQSYIIKLYKQGRRREKEKISRCCWGTQRLSHPCYFNSLATFNEECLLYHSKNRMFWGTLTKYTWGKVGYALVTDWYDDHLVE